MKESIKIDSVYLDFNSLPILRGIHLEFKEKKVTGLLGRNGCGKSCFLKIITGQLTPRSKHIKYKEKHLVSLYKKKGLINYLPQHEFHPKSLLLKDLLYFYGINEIAFLQEYPFLKKNIHNKFSDLSGGERRIIEVLLVLESKSKFSILDEPFSHIMPIYIDLVKDRIIKLSKRKGIMITDHQYKNILEISDDLYLMKNGILIPIEQAEDLKYHGYIR